MMGDLQGIVLRFKFHQNQASGFGVMVGRNLPFPIDLTIGLYSRLYCRTSHDVQDSKYSSTFYKSVSVLVKLVF